MMSRKEQRQKRLQIAYEITALKERQKKGEEIDKALFQKLGADYEAIGRKREEVPEVRAQPTGKRRGPLSAEDAGLTVGIYEERKDRKMTDVDVMEEFGISKREIVKWKKANGLVPQMKRAPKPKKKSNPSIQKHQPYKDGEPIPPRILKLAEANGIKYKTFLNRIYNLDWDYKAAATIPAGPNGRTKFERRKKDDN